MKNTDTTSPRTWRTWQGYGREEEQHDAMFGGRKYDLLEGRLKAQNKAIMTAIMTLININERQVDIINDHKARIEALEKQVKAINGAKLGPIVDQCG